MSTDRPESALLKTRIAPWLSVPSASDAVAFYETAFGAVVLYRLEEDGGKVAVAQLSLDGADFWLQSDPASSPAAAGELPVRMIVTVDDPDSHFERAVLAGATSVAPVADQYGWRTGRIKDPFGHHWEFAKLLATDP